MEFVQVFDIKRTIGAFDWVHFRKIFNGITALYTPVIAEGETHTLTIVIILMIFVTSKLHSEANLLNYENRLTHYRINDNPFACRKYTAQLLRTRISFYFHSVLKHYISFRHFFSISHDGWVKPPETLCVLDTRACIFPQTQSDKIATKATWMKVITVASCER